MFYINLKERRQWRRGKKAGKEGKTETKRRGRKGERGEGGRRKEERREERKREDFFFHRLSENILSLQFFLVFAELKTEGRGKARRGGCAFAAAEFGSL